MSQLVGRHSKQVFPKPSKAFRNISKGFLDIAKTFPDITNTFLNVPERFPDITKRLRDVTKSFPDVGDEAEVVAVLVASTEPETQGAWHKRLYNYRDRRGRRETQLKCNVALPSCSPCALWLSVKC